MVLLFSGFVRLAAAACGRVANTVGARGGAAEKRRCGRWVGGW